MAAAVVFEWLVVMFCASLSVCGSERALQMVHVVYRHGNRAPMYGYPSDPYTSSSWPQGFAQLTARGKLQQYRLGQWLRDRYATNDVFLNTTYIRGEIYVRSTDTDRTLMSAECNLAGFYPPKGLQEWSPNKTLPWQPIPIHTTVDEDDKLIGRALCPKRKENAKLVQESDVFMAYFEKYKVFLDFVRNKSGFVDGSFHDLHSVSDAAWFERADNKNLPSWINDTVFDKLVDLINFGYTVNLNDANNEITRLKGGLLLNEMTEHMIAKAEAPQNATYKMYMYSGHDVTVASVMASLGVFNDLWPPAASCLMVELYKETGRKRDRRHGDHEEIEIEMPAFDGIYTVDVYYYNESLKEPYQLQIKGCDKNCPLEELLKLTSKMRLTEEEWIEECGGEVGIHPHSHGTIIDYWDLHLNLGTIIAGVAIIFVLVLVLVVCCGVLFDPLKGKRKRRSLDSMELLKGDISDEENDLGV